MPSAEQLRSHFVKKLSELFQFDQPDLDFGFYRIMHAKAREVQDFFIEPHGLLHEDPASEKILFHKRIKDVEQRLNDPSVILNSFILSWTQCSELKWDNSQDELENMHVLFMADRDRYIGKLFARLKGWDEWLER